MVLDGTDNIIFLSLHKVPLDSVALESPVKQPLGWRDIREEEMVFLFSNDSQKEQISVY